MNIKRYLKFAYQEFKENVIPVIIFLGIAWAVMEILANIANIFIPNTPTIVDNLNNVAYIVSAISISLIAIFGWLRYSLVSKISIFLSKSSDTFNSIFKPINEVWEKAAAKHPVKQFIDWNELTVQSHLSHFKENQTNLIFAVSFISFVLVLMALFHADDWDFLMHFMIEDEPIQHTFLIDFGLVLLPMAGLLVISAFAQVKSFLDTLKWKKNLYYHYAERAAKNNPEDFDPIQAKQELCKFFAVGSVHQIHEMV